VSRLASAAAGIINSVQAAPDEVPLSDGALSLIVGGLQALTSKKEELAPLTGSAAVDLVHVLMQVRSGISIR